MKPLMHICLFVFLTGLVIDTNAQAVKKTDSVKKTAPVKPAIKKPKPISKEFSFGFRLHTDGWSLFVERGRSKSGDKYPDQFYNVRFWYVEFGEKKTPYEIKRTNTLGAYSNDKPTPFIYGKANNLYALKIGYAARKMIAGKPEEGTVSIHWVYGGALAIGLLKPYYVDAYVRDNTGSLIQKSIKYSGTDKDAFLYKPNIIGSSGFAKGLGETKIAPGVQLRTALHFDFAATKYSVLAVETGATFEYYAGDVQIMANKDPKSMYLGAYVSFQFGKRW